ncbi:MAG: alcohol dehydrogenase catalytic domain-containing protein [Clostridiales bacterium]|nr:alcohol dehydrogenase catalytic domain-containing protein [Clostridiales bacterium]
MADGVRNGAGDSARGGTYEVARDGACDGRGARGDMRDGTCDGTCDGSHESAHEDARDGGRWGERGGALMECAVFRGPENMAIERRPIPECPDGGALVRVMACGICGSDVRAYYNGLKGGAAEQIIGHEIAGEIVEAAPGASRFRAGDRVALAPDISCGECYYCRRGLVNLCLRHRMLGTHLPGGFAQYVALPRDVLEHGFAEPVPAGMSWTHAAFAETVSAVLACQKRVGVSLGDSALIIGDGPVGCLHAEVARARGASKVFIAGLDRLETAAGFQPDLLLDSRDPEGCREQVMRATGGIGVDFAICAVPDASAQERALALCRKRGVLVIYGGAPASAELSRLNSNAIHYGEITVTGSFSYPATGLADALSAIRAGHVRPERYISHVLPLREAARGIERLRSGKAVKIMLDPWARQPLP